VELAIDAAIEFPPEAEATGIELEQPEIKDEIRKNKINEDHIVRFNRRPPSKFIMTNYKPRLVNISDSS
jgi:hypothetical protein